MIPSLTDYRPDVLSDPLVVIGFMLTSFILLLPSAILFLGSYRWRCGLCGKVNTTNVIRFLLLWCDHTPDTH